MNTIKLNYKKPLLIMLIFTLALPLPALAKGNYQIPHGSSKGKLADSVSLLEKMEKAFRSIAKTVQPAVVFISISKSVSVPQFYYLDPFEEFFFGRGQRHKRRAPAPKKKYEQKGVGSGFIIDNKKGYILTNNHVVGQADAITIRTYDNQTFDAKVIATDANTDIAIIKVDNLPSALGQIYLADSKDIEVGDWVMAVGAPHRLDQSVTRGSISAKGRGSLSITDYGDFIQTDAAINPGNSGGPLINIHGDAIGMNTAIFSKSGGSQGLGFAIPSNLLRDIAHKLINKGKVERARLGVYIQALDKDLASEFGLKQEEGVLISQVEPDSPADEEGLKTGDVVTKVDGKPVRTPEQLKMVIGMSPLDRDVKIEYIRKKKKKIAHVRLEPVGGSSSKGGKQSNLMENWGLSLEQNNPNLRKEFNLGLSRGVVVTQVEPNSPASRAGLREGDVIVEVNHKEIESPRGFQKHAQTKSKLLLRVARGNYYLFFRLKK